MKFSLLRLLFEIISSSAHWNIQTVSKSHLAEHISVVYARLGCLRSSDICRKQILKDDNDLLTEQITVEFILAGFKLYMHGDQAVGTQT